MTSRTLFQRQSLDQITNVPDEIISVYVVENHIWADGGSAETRAQRRPERRTVEEFLIDPVRSFLNDILRQMAAPYTPQRRDNPIGQGYWIQAEFGSGKSHLLSFLGALALGDAETWRLVQHKEQAAGLGRRESLYNFYENGLARKAGEGRGILVAVKTLVGMGSGGAIDHDKSLTNYVLDAVADQYYLETGHSLPLYPTQILARRFLENDLERYRRDLGQFLRDPVYFDEEEQEDLTAFLRDLQDTSDPTAQRDCGQKLWDFYTRYLKVRPDIPVDTEEILKHMVEQLLAAGYAGLLLILDELSIFMKNRNEAQRIDDEATLVVLSNRLAKVENLPIWTVCAAQQKLENRMGIKNIIARERLDLWPLLNKEDYYYDIALSRVRDIVQPHAIAQYYEDYKRGFSWPEAVGRDRFAHFFPFYPPSIDVVRAISYNLTTVRSALYFMLQALKTARKKRSTDLISLWQLFDEVVAYEEDPSGTTRAISSIKTKWPDEWKAYEQARHQLGTITRGHLAMHRSRCEKIVKTLFLYHVANLAPNGLGHEQLMNSVMEWRDHDGGQTADQLDNIQHYELLCDKIAIELAQVSKVGPDFRFNPTSIGPDPRDLFQQARAEAEHNEVARRQAWEALLALDKWEVRSALMTLDLTTGLRSIFRDVAPASQTELTLNWHGREIKGRVLMRDLLDISRRDRALLAINSAQTGEDFHVYISATPAAAELDRLAGRAQDGRVLLWAPDALTPAEEGLLLDFAAYRALTAEHQGRDTAEAKVVLEFVQQRLRAQMGAIYRIVTDSYSRGRMAAQDHADIPFFAAGELPSILTPIITQLLDAIYLSKEMTFDAPAPFNDTNAINVINGIVKHGEFPRGVRPDRYVSASQNYGFALQIMRKPNDKKLDLRDCRYTRDMLAWIESRPVDGAADLPVETLYKNFMGVNGPGGRHYGLSRRMVQLYLLALVRNGKLRVTLSGRAAPVEAIDYSNIAAIDFKTSVLDALERVQRLKPPQGWELLAPFAAVLLDDPTLKETRQDADIQAGLERLLAWKRAELAPCRQLREAIAALFRDVGQPDPLAQALRQWEEFLASPVQAQESISFVLSGLYTAFGYRALHDNVVQAAEVDDLTARRQEVAAARLLLGYQQRIRTVARYAALTLPDDPALADIAAALNQTRARLTRLGEWLRQPARLETELLAPAESAGQSYRARYLQLFDQVVSHTEQARQTIESLGQGPAYQALSNLAQVSQLGADARPALEQQLRRAQTDTALFPSTLRRVDVERDLESDPLPRSCPLTLENGERWIAQARATLAHCQTLVQAALRDKAALLHSAALRERLAQGQADAWIAGLLAQPTVEALAAYLRQTLGAEGIDGAARLSRYLKRIRVRKLALADFTPSQRTLEAADVEKVVGEFRRFLEDGLQGEADEWRVIELE